jgi:hypothetical protein
MHATHLPALVPLRALAAASAVAASGGGLTLHDGRGSFGLQSPDGQLLLRSVLEPRPKLDRKSESLLSDKDIL